MSIDINAKLIEMGASKFAFARECFTGVMELPSPKFHREICADLDNQEMMNYVVQAPRGHAKTTYVGCIDPIHELLFSGIMGKKPEFITLVSKTTSHTRSLVKTIIDHIVNNPALKYYFGSIMDQVYRRRDSFPKSVSTSCTWSWISYPRSNPLQYAPFTLRH